MGASSSKKNNRKVTGGKLTLTTPTAIPIPLSPISISNSDNNHRTHSFSHTHSHNRINTTQNYKQGLGKDEPLSEGALLGGIGSFMALAKPSAPLASSSASSGSSDSLNKTLPSSGSPLNKKNLIQRLTNSFKSKNKVKVHPSEPQQKIIIHKYDNQQVNNKTNGDDNEADDEHEQEDKKINNNLRGTHLDYSIRLNGIIGLELNGNNLINGSRSKIKKYRSVSEPMTHNEISTDLGISSDDENNTKTNKFISNNKPQPLSILTHNDNNQMKIIHEKVNYYNDEPHIAPISPLNHNTIDTPITTPTIPTTASTNTINNMPDRPMLSPTVNIPGQISPCLNTSLPTPRLATSTGSVSFNDGQRDPSTTTQSNDKGNSSFPVKVRKMLRKFSSSIGSCDEHSTIAGPVYGLGAGHRLLVQRALHRKRRTSHKSNNPLYIPGYSARIPSTVKHKPIFIKASSMFS